MISIPYLALIPLLAFFDGLAGGRPAVPGRGVWYGALVLGLYGFLVLHLTALLAVGLALTFYVWRDSPPKIFGGELDKATVGTFARHLLVLPFAFLNLAAWPYAIAALVCWAIVATAAAPLARTHNDIWEPVRGALLGVVLVVILNLTKLLS